MFGDVAPGCTGQLHQNGSRHSNGATILCNRGWRPGRGPAWPWPLQVCRALLLWFPDPKTPPSEKLVAAVAADFRGPARAKHPPVELGRRPAVGPDSRFCRVAGFGLCQVTVAAPAY